MRELFQPQVAKLLNYRIKISTPTILDREADNSYFIEEISCALTCKRPFRPGDCPNFEPVSPIRPKHFASERSPPLPTPRTSRGETEYPLKKKEPKCISITSVLEYVNQIVVSTIHRPNTDKMYNGEQQEYDEIINTKEGRR